MSENKDLDLIVAYDNRTEGTHTVLRKTEKGWIIKGNAPNPRNNIWASIYRALPDDLIKKYTEIMDMCVKKGTEAPKYKAHITFGERYFAKSKGWFKMILHVEPIEQY